METVDVVIVGAGLAGLSAAAGLTSTELTSAGFADPGHPGAVPAGAGLADVPPPGAAAPHPSGASERLDVLVLESADDVGGRVRTDEVGGFLLDRGFQVLLPSYPEIRRQVDLPALQPRAFPRSVLLRDGVRSVPLGDPLQDVAALGGLVPGRALGAVDLAKLAATSARAALARPESIIAGPERTTRAELLAVGLSPGAVERVLAPFLRGVFLEGDLDTSSRFFRLVWRCFLRAAPVLPARGMAELPRQLAARLPPGTIRFGQRVVEIAEAPGANGPATAGLAEVRLAGGGVVRARAVVVATDGEAAARLLPGLRAPHWHGVTTWYFSAPAPPMRGGALVLDARAKPGPVVNTVVLSAVAPEYAPPGADLVAASVLSAGGAGASGSGSGGTGTGPPEAAAAAV
ncbi:FAD-dependent oxidoreductase [Parafrankia discariae]|uniref:FAD-dependent oxidoreductase n=1 Tax=Parafrankia discariae TaxID=365528 RepID=UPI0003774AEE|nr:FAD-dependent oxidoreductase [Parafrankia discariae]